MTRDIRSKLKPTAAFAGLLTAATLVFGAAEVSQAQHTGPRAPVRDPNRVFRKYPKSWMEIKVQNIVTQKQDFSCGAAALATMLTYHIGDRTTELRILQEADAMFTPEELLDRIQKGLTLTDLRRLAVELGYPATIGKLTLQDLADSKTPIIVGIIVNEYDHFVVYRGMDGKYIYLADPARGNLRVPIREFLGQWQQNLGLVVVPKDQSTVNWSPLMLQADEMMLGETNRLYVRDRLTTGPGASGN